MHSYRHTIALSLFVLLPLCASAAWGQTVQLPQFEFSGVGTTIVVPNRGEIVIGGVNTGGGRTGPGVALRAREDGGVLAGITATVHDLAELDRAVLAVAAAQRRATPRERTFGSAPDAAIRRRSTCSRYRPDS